MISDFYFIQKSKINNKDIYSLENNGIYYYTGGWHIKGVYSAILGSHTATSRRIPRCACLPWVIDQMTRSLPNLKPRSFWAFIPPHPGAGIAVSGEWVSERIGTGFRRNYTPTGSRRKRSRS